MADNAENSTPRKRRVAEDAPVTVSLNHTYHRKDNEKERVVPFHLDRELVYYAPESSGREFKMLLKDFLEEFEPANDDPNAD